MGEISVRFVVENDPEKSSDVSQEFSADVAQLNGVLCHAPPTVAPEPGAKGDPITMGTVAIAAVSGPALAALVNMIGSYLSRDHRNEAEIKTADGRTVRISSQKFKREELVEILRQLLDLTKG